MRIMETYELFYILQFTTKKHKHTLHLAAYNS
jgi:hypothetical protein